MDHHNCCVIYCDDRVRTERLVKKESVATSAVSQKSSQPGYFDLLEEPYELQCNVKAILGVFNSGMPIALTRMRVPAACSQHTSIRLLVLPLSNFAFVQFIFVPREGLSPSSLLSTTTLSALIVHQYSLCSMFTLMQKVTK